MRSIHLDARKLLGFRLYADASGARPDAKLGAKVGVKEGLKPAVKLGAKVGVKEVHKPV